MNTPKLRFKTFNDEWNSYTLGEVTELSDGTHFTPTYKTTGIPFWSVETITTNAPVKYISKEEHEEINKRCNPQRNDILITRISSGINSLGVPKLVDWDTPFSIYVSVGLIKSNEKFDSKFLVEYIKTPIYKREFLSKSLLTASPKKINMNNLATTLVKFPSLKEQRILGGFFSLFEEKIKLQQEKIDLLKEQKKGYLQKIFNKSYRFKGFEAPWTTAKVSEIATLVNGRAYKKDELLDTGKYRVLRVGNFFTNDSWYYSDLELDENKYAEKDDLLYAWSASFGPKIWNEEKVIYHYHIWKVIPNKSFVIRDFLYHWFEFDKTRILSQKNGSTLVHITKGGLEETLIEIPCQKEQKIISDFLNALDKKISLTEETLEKLQQQKQAFMQQMFI